MTYEICPFSTALAFTLAAVSRFDGFSVPPPSKKTRNALQR
jgi:hypothetical protein